MVLRHLCSVKIAILAPSMSRRHSYWVILLSRTLMDSQATENVKLFTGRSWLVWMKIPRVILWGDMKNGKCNRRKEEQLSCRKSKAV